MLTGVNSGTRPALRIGARASFATALMYSHSCKFQVFSLIVLRSHPVQSWPEESRRKAIAISLHGDEGTGKRSKSVMILSWSPLAVHDAAMMSKYPFCAPRLILQ